MAAIPFFIPALNFSSKMVRFQCIVTLLYPDFTIHPCGLTSVRENIYPLFLFALVAVWNVMCEK
jgi:hypothetical protein